MGRKSKKEKRMNDLLEKGIEIIIQGLKNGNITEKDLAKDDNDNEKTNNKTVVIK